MATRLNRNHTESCLSRIKTSQLLNRLQNHALGILKNEVTREPLILTDSQVKSSIFLIERTLAKAEAPRQLNVTGTLSLEQLVAGSVLPTRAPAQNLALNGATPAESTVDHANGG